MAGRRSVWGDPEVQELAGGFVPATDETWRLQTSDDPQARFFRTMVDGSPEPIRGSRQGTYVCTPGGELLARVNSTDPRRIAETLRKGLAAWEALPAEARARPAPASASPAHRFEDSFPADGLVLDAVHRDLEGSGDAWVPGGGRWNVDHVWFSPDEARGWVPLEDTVGARVDLPRFLRERLARFHLVDNVRGQEGPFAPEDVELSEVASTVVAIEGDRVVLTIEGRTRTVSDGVWKLGENLWKQFPNRPRGVEARLAGGAVFDRTTERFVSFQLVALGESWGGSGLNGRRGAEPDARQPLAWRFTRAGDLPADRVPPAFIDIYGAEWVQPPERVTSASH